MANRDIAFVSDPEYGADGREIGRRFRRGGYINVDAQTWRQMEDDGRYIFFDRNCDTHFRYKCKTTSGDGAIAVTVEQFDDLHDALYWLIGGTV